MISVENAVWEMPRQGEHLRATDAAGGLSVLDIDGRVKSRAVHIPGSLSWLLCPSA